MKSIWRLELTNSKITYLSFIPSKLIIISYIALCRLSEKKKGESDIDIFFFLNEYLEFCVSEETVNKHYITALFIRNKNEHRIHIISFTKIFQVDNILLI